MGISELRDRQAELLVRKSKLERELKIRRNRDAGIMSLLEDMPMPRALLTIQKDLRAVENELTDIEAGLTPGLRPATPKGELKEVVRVWAESEGFLPGKSVPSPKIAKFVRDNKDEFPNLNDGSVRATLSRLGYSAEKKDPEA
jgi:hypothetical protein